MLPVRKSTDHLLHFVKTGSKTVASRNAEWLVTWEITGHSGRPVSKNINVKPSSIKYLLPWQLFEALKEVVLWLCGGVAWVQS